MIGPLFCPRHCLIVTSLWIGLWGCTESPESDGPRDALCEGECLTPDAFSDTHDLGNNADADVSPDGTPFDHDDDAERTDMMGMEIDSMVLPDVCESQDGSPSMGGLGGAALVQRFDSGGPLAENQFMVANLTGEMFASPHILLVRGGRLEVMEADGRPLWWSDDKDLVALVSVDDLDGDGRRELVAQSAREVRVYDALSGRLRWALPEDAFDTDDVVSIVRIELLDLNGDERPELYVTDGGCGDGGTGRGAVFTFGSDNFGERVSVIAGPRLNGRCGRWQTFSQNPAGDQIYLGVSDGDGINLFDPLTGERYACGVVVGAPPNGPLPTLSFFDGRPGWFVFLSDRIIRVRSDERLDGSCEVNAVVSTEWSSPIADAVGPMGSSVFQSPGMDGTALVTSIRQAADARWSVVMYGVDNQRVLLDDARLLNVVSTDEGYHLLVLDSPDEPGQRGQNGCKSIRVNALGEVQSERRLGAHCEVMRTGRDPYRSVELREPEWVHIDGETAWYARIFDTVEEIGESTPRLARFDMDGSVTVIDLERPARTTIAACSEMSCRLGGVPVALGVVSDDGFLALHADDGRVLNISHSPPEPDVRRPSGLSHVSASGADTRFFSVNEVGLLSGFGGPIPDIQRLWSTSLGGVSRGDYQLQSIVGETGTLGVVARTPRLSPGAITFMDAETGEVSWSHELPSDEIRTMRVLDQVRGPTGETTHLIRYDRQALEGPVRLPEDCQQGHHIGIPRDQSDPDCPAQQILRRSVTALNPSDGRCLWHSSLEPTSVCSSPGYQDVSVVGDLILVTESTGLTALHASTGAERARIDLGQINPGVGRGGGRIISSGDGHLIRYGGNGPPEKYTQDLELIWRGGLIEGIRSQSWFGRDAVVLGGAVWTTPGPGWPLYRYALDDGEVLGLIGLAEGAIFGDAEPTGQYVDVLVLEPTDDVDGTGQPGLLAVTADGYLYGIDTQGTLVWTRTFDGRIGRPQGGIGGPAATGLWAFPLGSGQIDLLGMPAPSPPPVVWDRQCPLTETCVFKDLNEQDSVDGICAEWTPLMGVDGYEIRVVGPGGAPLTPWIDVGAVTRYQIPDESVESVSLGSFYAVQIRSYVREAGVRSVSSPVRSNGVYLVNDSAPRLVLEGDVDQFSPGSAGVRFSLSLSDDQALAGWGFDIVRRDSGEHVRRLGGTGLNDTEFSAERVWLGRDRFELTVPDGIYRAVLTGIDQLGNQSSVSRDVQVCADECP